MEERWFADVGSCLELHAFFFYIFFLLKRLVHFYSYIFLRSISRSTKEINTKEEKKIMYSLALE